MEKKSYLSPEANFIELTSDIILISGDIDVDNDKDWGVMIPMESPKYSGDDLNW